VGQRPGPAQPVTNPNDRRGLAWDRLAPMPEFRMHVTGPTLASALVRLGGASIKAYGPVATARGTGHNQTNL
jgi:hypothetical protein